MTKALITLGYHYGEIDWGRAVRDEYFKRSLKGNRNVTFYEIQGSDVKTGDPCRKSEQEATRKIEEEGFGLLLNIHCGFDANSNRLKKHYYGRDYELIEKVMHLNSITVYKHELIFGRYKYAGIPYALLDAEFKRPETGENLNRAEYPDLIKIVSKEEYNKLLDETLTLINKIYDAHQN